MININDHYTREKLLQYLNINLDIDVMMLIEAHLDKCESCSELIEELKPECNKVERDQYFEETLKLIRASRVTNGFFFKQRRILYFAIGIIIISGGLWAAQYFQLLNFRNDQINSLMDIDSLITSEISIDSTQLGDSSRYLTDSTNMEIKSDDLMYRNQSVPSTLQITNESPTTLSEPITQTTPAANKEIAPVDKNPSAELKNNGDVISKKHQTDSVLVADQIKEVPIVKTGTISVVASSNQQAQPITGYSSFNQYIKSNYKYPEPAIVNNLQGTVVVQFEVLDDGSVIGLQILSGIDESCNKLARDILLNGPKWKPYIGVDSVANNTATLKVNFTL